jgi:hypothetical protein
VSGYGDCTYGGGTYGDLCGGAAPVQQHGGMSAGHRQDGDHRQLDDEDVLLTLPRH